jgi:hypothetical protein
MLAWIRHRAGRDKRLGERGARIVGVSRSIAGTPKPSAIFTKSGSALELRGEQALAVEQRLLLEHQAERRCCSSARS